MQSKIQNEKDVSSGIRTSNLSHWNFDAGAVDRSASPIDSYEKLCLKVLQDHNIWLKQHVTKHVSVIAKIYVDNRQTNRQTGQNNMTSIIRSGGIKIESANADGMCFFYLLT